MAQLTVLQLSRGRGGKPLWFAPHGWKTTLDCRLLKIPFEVEYVVSAQLAEELPKRFGLDTVTVPTLLVKQEDGKERVIVDSFDIADYLESQYATSSQSLFTQDGNGSATNVAAGKALARFIELWMQTSFGPVITPGMLASSFAQFPTEGNPGHDGASRSRFESKVGPARMKELGDLARDPTWSEDLYTRVRKELAIVNRLLKDQERPGSGGPFFLGSKPTHADFVLFCYYPYALTNRDLVKNTFRHPDLPYISKWLDAMFASGLVSEDEFRFSE